MIGLQVRGRDVSDSEAAPLKGGDSHEDVMRCTAGSWGDSFGKNFSALLPMPPSNPTAPKGDAGGIGGTGGGAAAAAARGLYEGPGGSGFIGWKG